MSPFRASSFEVAVTFGTSVNRRNILQGWLRHREKLRSLGFVNGFQWLDGSFVEDKIPKDLDIVTFADRPAGVDSTSALMALRGKNLGEFDRARVKAVYSLDAFFVDLNASGSGIVNITRYLNGLFSHRRGDELWKGMLEVNLNSVADDKAALGVLNAPQAGGATP